MNAEISIRNTQLTLFSERSRTDMLEEALRRVLKTLFANLGPSWLSHNFNEHKDLVAK